MWFVLHSGGVRQTGLAPNTTYLLTAWIKSSRAAAVFLGLGGMAEMSIGANDFI
jgi:hypothetical protein